MNCLYCLYCLYRKELDGYIPWWCIALDACAQPETGPLPVPCRRPGKLVQGSSDSDRPSKEVPSSAEAVAVAVWGRAEAVFRRRPHWRSQWAWGAHRQRLKWSRRYREVGTDRWTRNCQCPYNHSISFSNNARVFHPTQRNATPTPTHKT